MLERIPDIDILPPESSVTMDRQKAIRGHFNYLYSLGSKIVESVDPNQRRVEQPGVIRTRVAVDIPFAGNWLTVNVKDIHFNDLLRNVLPDDPVSVSTRLWSGREKNDEFGSEPMGNEVSLSANDSDRDNLRVDTNYERVMQSVFELSRTLIAVEASLGLVVQPAERSA